MIKAETKVTKTENFMDFRINKKYLMLLPPALCLFVLPVSTETTKQQNHLSKLMTQMIWYLSKSQVRKYMPYQEKGHFLNFILDSLIYSEKWEGLINLSKK